MRDMQPTVAASATQAEERLRFVLAGLDQALVAFSAGVDSTYLLAVAHDVLGDRCTAVTADSPSLARSDLAQAQAFCRQRGIAHQVVATDEFADERYVANDGLRCYACKTALFAAIDGLLAVAAGGRADNRLLLGAVVDDFSDHRPGLRAAQEAGARWPLAEAGFSKAFVRQRSREWGLTSWSQPARPCLSSRFPYGEPVTVAGLRMIEAAEAWLHERGFAECRARHHAVGGGRGSLCRVEVPVGLIAEVVAVRAELVTALRDIGYQHVALDLAGLVSGGFNAQLTAGERALGQVTP